MRHIKKNPEPTLFVQWKIDNDTILQDKYKTKSGTEIWNWFGKTFPTVRDDLRQALLQEQGNICCYCGQDISHLPTTIEHFNPKGVDTENRIFDYPNLILSCNYSEVSEPSFIHFLQTEDYKELDTQDKIANLAGCSTKKLRNFNPILSGKDPRKSITEIKKGEYLYLYIRHCENKKGDTEPKNTIISPLDTGCAKYFEYNANGKINIIGTTDDIAKNILDGVLNLNAANLCQMRQDAYDKAEKVKQSLEKAFKNGIIDEDELLYEIDIQDEPDENGKRTAFCFIFTYLLNQLL